MPPETTWILDSYKVSPGYYLNTCTIFVSLRRLQAGKLDEHYSIIDASDNLPFLSISNGQPITFTYEDNNDVSILSKCSYKARRKVKACVAEYLRIKNARNKD